VDLTRGGERGGGDRSEQETVVVMEEDEMAVFFFLKFNRVICCGYVPFNGKVISVTIQRVNVQVSIVHRSLVQHP